MQKPDKVTQSAQDLAVRAAISTISVDTTSQVSDSVDNKWECFCTVCQDQATTVLLHLSDSTRDCPVLGDGGKPLQPLTPLGYITSPIDIFQFGMDKFDVDVIKEIPLPVDSYALENVCKKL